MEDRRALEALVVENPELERLETLLDQFNVFEAIGAVRQELRHSDFLAFLLNPQQAHGLADAFVKRLLQRVLASPSSGGFPINPIDLDVWSLDDLIVLREWENIDILILDDVHKLAVIIENKIGSGEHSGQLQRYRKVVTHHYPDYRQICLYLTPDGNVPTDEYYIPVAYSAICTALESLLESRATTIGSEVQVIIRHYTQMLRRYVVGESEIAALCRRIYQRHQRALDLIFEHRPDRQATLRQFCEQVLSETPGLALDTSGKSTIRLFPQIWDEIPALRAGSTWTSSGRLLLFEITNGADSLRLKLIIGPGPQETRQRIFDFVSSRQPPFKLADKKLYPRWTTIYSRVLLTAKAYEATDDELLSVARKNWESFVHDDVTVVTDNIVAVFSNQAGQQA